MGDRDDEIYHPAFVADLFDRCARNYRIWSAVASFGVIALWRRQCVSRLPGQQAIARHKGADVNMRTPLIYDLMAGTGEIWPHLQRLYPRAQIVAVDLSPEMHAVAKDRLTRSRADRITHLQADVLETDLPEGQADIVVASFGLKTLSPRGQVRLAERIAHLLRPGGTFALIEASDPLAWRLRPFYRFYLDRCLPLIERFFLRGAQDFSYLGVYTRSFGDCSHFAEALRAQGLFVSQRAHIFGCASSVAGFKPVAEPSTAP